MGRRSAKGARARAVAVGLCLVLSLTGASAPARAGHEPAHFLAELTERALSQLTQAGVDTTEKRRRFRALIDEGFDVLAIGRFVLGRYWRQADRSTQEAFLQAFEEMMVARSLPLFESYNGERVVVGDAVPLGSNEGFFAVSSLVTRPEGPPIAVDWRIRRTAQGFRIVDIVAEGVSLAVTLRSEYGTALKNHDGDVAKLVEEMRIKFSAD